MTRYDAIVIGGGLVGSAIGYGLVRHWGFAPRSSTKDDIAYRASRGNFGLVWVQSKGERRAPLSALDPALGG